MLIKTGQKIKVKKVNVEEREFLNKDGQTKVRRKVVNIGFLDGDGDMCKVTAFDPAFPIPKDGEEWPLPPVKRLECFDGLIQNLMV